MPLLRGKRFTPSPCANTAAVGSRRPPYPSHGSNPRGPDSPRTDFACPSSGIQRGGMGGCRGGERGSNLAVGGDLGRSEERPSQRHLRLRLRLRLACSARVEGCLPVWSDWGEIGGLGAGKREEGGWREERRERLRGRARGQNGMSGVRPAHADTHGRPAEFGMGRTTGGWFRSGLA
jgi:hypothetical protein